MPEIENTDTSLRDESPLPINIANIGDWIRRTFRSARISNRNYAKGSLSLMRALRMFAPNLRRPVFAIGAPRSGTTFLGECLARLPEISYHFEPVLTKAAARYVHEGLWPEYRARFLYRSTYAWLMRINMETDLRFCEKTPGNCFVIPFLDRSFTGAKFIHIVRDGRDAAISLAKKPWYRNEARHSGARDPDGYYLGPSTRFWVEPNRLDAYVRTNDLHRCIWLWRRYVESALAGAASIPAERYLQISYEKFLDKPAEYADLITGFLEISNPLSRELFRNTVVASAREDSVGRWKVELDHHQKLELNAEAGYLLQKLGYEL